MAGNSTLKYTLTSTFHDPYANLAAAIINSGVRCHDTEFLESNWADILRRICELDIKMYGERDILTTRGLIKYVKYKTVYANSEGMV